MQLAKLLLGLMVSATLVSCATREEREEAEAKKAAAKAGPSIEAKQVAAEQETSFVTEFAFPKGSAELTEQAKADVRRVISNAKRNGDIDEIKVITWGDSEYPSVHTKKLSKAEIDLVKKRNKAIKDFVKEFSNTDVDSHSMAERPGTITNLLNTEDAKVKKSLEVAGIPTTDTAVKTPSKASKSIIMVITE
ncbi:hypothetical protein [Bdellovibrio reynosensis]|uniref:OmpA-like domain-containing protein n=1 Tax=Bdellovibrio reynosensis TaxID=2835041 RepID=A0ABY4CHV9_9BACT|nr:hypothetical protein [Bdellovibrio reynosensis]UOF01795.1 hypothetical protein MNR06_02360 [Bdellovibrio reynosensis]